MINLSALVYQIDRHSKIPIFVQLTNAIRHRIVSGEIEQNKKLPPSRNLASELGVSRSTITSSYEQLVAEGYIEGRRGSGYFTCPVGDIDIKPRGNKIPKKDKAPLPRKRQYRHPSFPDMRLFPYRQWAQCLSRVSRLSPESLVTVTDSFGDLELRQSVAQFLRDWRGLDTQPEQIIITAGSIDALEICIRTLASPGDYIGLENPGYQPLRNIALNLGMHPVWLDMDSQGARVQSSGQKTALTILTPSHHFPLGGAMSPLRRREFLHWAEQSDSWIIEDDYDSEFRYAGSPIQALAGFDTTHRTIYVGTFSKVFSVGLRLGFLVSPPELLNRFSNTLAEYGVKAATTAQRALSEFMDSGEFYRHIRRARRIYGERRKILIHNLQTRLGEIINIEDHAAGMQLLAELPEHFDDKAIVEKARNQGVIVNALSSHYAAGIPDKGLVMGFCGFDEAEIERGVMIIADIIEDIHGLNQKFKVKS